MVLENSVQESTNCFPRLYSEDFDSQLKEAIDETLNNECFQRELSNLK
jgi:hypothetical protein